MGHRTAWLGAVLVASGCAGTSVASGPVEPLRYVGSSTVAIVLRNAEPVYGGVALDIETSSESAGGEQAIVAGTTDLAGIAAEPRAETLAAGVSSTLIGRDAIAVIVHADNPIQDLSLADLRRLFTGGVRNWSEVGGADLPIQPLIVGPESATREVFRRVVLGAADYSGCDVIRPDVDIVAAVAADPGAIGQISFSFMAQTGGVRALGIDGHEPSVTNFEYPISRPLFLLWRPGNPALERFVHWMESDAGQQLVRRDFVSIRAVGSVRPSAERGPAAGARTGKLIVHTETFLVDDGGISYFPHRSYEILDQHGALISRVRNHSGLNDESPSQVSLPAGTYLVRTEAGRVGSVEFFVTVAEDETTTVHVEEMLRG